MAERGNKEAIRIGGGNQDSGDLLRIAKAEMTPVLAAIVRFVHAVADGEVGTLESFAATNVEDVGVGGRDRDGANGAGRLLVEERLPGAAIVVGLPDAAVVHANEKNVGLVGD